MCEADSVKWRLVFVKYIICTAILWSKYYSGLFYFFSSFFFHQHLLRKGQWSPYLSLKIEIDYSILGPKFALQKLVRLDLNHFVHMAFDLLIQRQNSYASGNKISIGVKNQCRLSNFVRHCFVGSGGAVLVFWVDIYSSKTQVSIWGWST